MDLAGCGQLHVGEAEAAEIAGATSVITDVVRNSVLAVECKIHRACPIPRWPYRCMPIFIQNKVKGDTLTTAYNTAFDDESDDGRQAELIDDAVVRALAARDLKDARAYGSVAQIDAYTLPNGDHSYRIYASLLAIPLEDDAEEEDVLVARMPLKLITGARVSDVHVRITLTPDGANDVNISMGVAVEYPHALLIGVITQCGIGDGSPYMLVQFATLRDAETAADAINHSPHCNVWRVFDRDMQAPEIGECILKARRPVNRAVAANCVGIVPQRTRGLVSHVDRVLVTQVIVTGTTDLLVQPDFDFTQWTEGDLLFMEMAPDTDHVLSVSGAHDASLLTHYHIRYIQAHERAEQPCMFVGIYTGSASSATHRYVTVVIASSLQSQRIVAPCAH